MTVDVNKFLRELELLVNIDSGQGNPAGITAVGNFFADRMRARGWICEQVDLGDKTGKCTVIKNRESDRYDLMLVGHVDTVFPTGEALKRPFRRDESRAYGVGVIDMKQGALTMLYIMEALPDEINEKLNIVAIFNPDEEINSIYSRPLIDKYAEMSDHAFVFEAASTDGSHTIARKGIYRSVVKFHGRAGHAGYIHDGGSVSAVNELVFWASELNKLCNKDTDTSVNVGRISGGEKHNIVPDYAEMEFEARYNSLPEYEKLLSLVDILKEHAVQAGVNVEFCDEFEMPPLVPTDKTVEFEKRMRALSYRLGIPYKIKSRGGLSDANHISKYCPVTVDGLAPTGDFDHSEFEYLEISTIEPNVKFAYELVCELANYK